MKAKWYKVELCGANMQLLPKKEEERRDERLLRHLFAFA